MSKNLDFINEASAKNDGPVNSGHLSRLDNVIALVIYLRLKGDSYHLKYFHWKLLGLRPVVAKVQRFLDLRAAGVVIKGGEQILADNDSGYWAKVIDQCFDYLETLTPKDD